MEAEAELLERFLSEVPSHAAILERIHELGELGTAACPGRTSDDQITYHKNTNGNGVADLGISMRAYELAKADGRGNWIKLPEPEDLPLAL